MNERIRQIAEQVYGSAATEQEIKFAELIVRECAKVCLDEGAKFRGEQDITDFKLCSFAIKVHFGVSK